MRLQSNIVMTQGSAWCADSCGHSRFDGCPAFMNKSVPYVVALVLAAGALTPLYFSHHATPGAKTHAGKAESGIQKISYALGYQVSQQTPPDLDGSQFVQGFNDGRVHKAPAYTEQEIQQALVAYQQETQQKAQAKSEGNADAGKTFLAENAKKAGIKTTASGLQYEVIKEGTGATPTATSQVTVNYEGKLIDGTVFDSSFARHEPVTFGLNQVIPGWTEGLQLMKEGGRYRFFIPAELGYGAQETGTIPANSTLIFDVELLKVAQ